MARQFQIPGGPFINAEQDEREYMLLGYGMFNDEATPAAPQPAAETLIVVTTGLVW